MNRKRLEALAWKCTHRDFKGKRADGTKCVLHLIPQRGPCSVPLASLTDDELRARIPRWHVVTSSAGGRVLGVFGAALLSEAQECARRVESMTGFPAYVLQVDGPRPKVTA
jgi:hypothetical protein